MYTDSFSECVDVGIDLLCNSKAERIAIWHHEQTDKYAVVAENSPAELEYLAAFKKSRIILNMDYFQMKVFLHQIRIVQVRLGINGANKEDSSDRKQSGSMPERLDAGGIECQAGRTGDNSELPGSDDNDNESDTRRDIGDKTESDNRKAIN